MMKTFYRRTLPHILPIGATFFVTFRLHGSLPHGFMQKLTEDFEAKVFEIRTSFWLNPEAEIYRQQKIFFKRFDEGLDKVYNGVRYLESEKVAQIVMKKIHQYDGELYDLLSYCIMPNHVHLLIDTAIQLNGLKNESEINEENYIQLDKIMKLIKGGSSYEINRFLGRTGAFWQRESYDHYVRNGKELVNIIWYIVRNPVKGRLVLEWEDFEYTYWKNVDS
ncbi:MAG: transposase [Saprospiraceae bacterium]